MPAEQLLEATAKQGLPRLAATVDGYFLPKPPVEILAAGEQAHVPLLAGWNSEEQGARSVLGTCRADARELRRGGEEAVPGAGRRGSEAVPGRDERGGGRVGHRAGQRSLYRLQHVEVARPARQDRRQADLPLLLLAAAAGDDRGNGQRGRGTRGRRDARWRCPGGPPAGPARRGPFRGDRIRDGQPRLEHGVRVDARGSQGVGDVPGVFRQLRQDWRSERR